MVARLNNTDEKVNNYSIEIPSTQLQQNRMHLKTTENCVLVDNCAVRGFTMTDCKNTHRIYRALQINSKTYITISSSCMESQFGSVYVNRITT